MTYAFAALSRCISRGDPSVALPDWQCEVGSLPFIVIGGVLGLICLLFPAFARPYLRHPDSDPSSNKDWQIRAMGAILLIAVYSFAIAIFKD